MVIVCVKFFLFFFLFSYQWKKFHSRNEGKKNMKKKNFSPFLEKLFRHENYPWINIFVLFSLTIHKYFHKIHTRTDFFTNFSRPCSIQVDKNVSQAIQLRMKGEKKFGTRKIFQFQFNPQSNVKLSLKIP